MPVTTDLRNLGDAQLCREIVASIEQALSDKRGEWRVSGLGALLRLPPESRADHPGADRFRQHNAFFILRRRNDCHGPTCSRLTNTNSL
jgi:hypothetical protein